MGADAVMSLVFMPEVDIPANGQITIEAPTATFKPISATNQIQCEVIDPSSITLSDCIQIDDTQILMTLQT